MESILLSGATGFVGARVLEFLSDQNVRVIGRLAPPNHCGDFYPVDLAQDSDLLDALQGVEVVIHSAARVHVMDDSAENPLEAYRKVNTFGTLRLAKQAADSGVKRFIFVSTIKVNGEHTSIDSPFGYDDVCAPEDPYAVSKMEAENGLKELAKLTGMEVVIIRPPLVYGPGVKANFAAMMKLAGRNLPLPLGAIKNKRSLVALDNLADLIVTCIKHPKAANQVFLVSDDYDVSTTELLSTMTRAAGKKPRLLPVPMILIRLAATLLGKKALAERLCDSLIVDISHTKKELGWSPLLSLEEGIERCFLDEV